MLERNWYSIVTYRDEKYFVLHGWSLYYNEGISLYELDTACLISLAALTQGDALDLIDKELGGICLTAVDYSEEEARFEIDNYYGVGLPGTHLPLDELTIDTPLGHYWF